QELVARLVKRQVACSMSGCMEHLQMPLRRPVRAPSQGQPLPVLESCVNRHGADEGPGGKPMCQNRNSIPADAALDGTDVILMLMRHQYSLEPAAGRQVLIDG